jgi:sialidase-1
MFRSIALAIGCCLLSAYGLTAEPLLDKTDLFTSGEDGYALYRIPGIVVTPKGTVLAYCEARKNPGGDWGQIDVMLRRSTDGGKTWLPRQHLAIPGAFERNPAAVAHKLGKDGEITFNNPVAIADRNTGAVHFFICVEYARCFYLKSDDEGRSFSKPVEITATFDEFKKEYPWRVLATGPGHGIQLTSGRLIVPVWLSTGDGGHAHRPSAVSVIHSDDHGATWRRGDIVTRDPDFANPSETAAVQLRDGRVMLNIRNEDKRLRRLVSYSKDGATGWTRPQFVDLPEPVCMASLVRLSFATDGGKNAILFSNPDNPTNRQRKNVSVRLSHDEGATWPIVKPLEPGPSGYSDLAVAPDGTIYCFYERGALDKNAFRVRNLCVARFNVQWLTQKRAD